MMEAKNLSKTLPNGKLLLNGISFSVSEGDVVGVLGLSGVGKTVLIRCLNALTKPDSGSVVLGYDGGLDITSCSGKRLKEARRSIAMIFQSFNLMDRLSVLDNVLIGRLGYKGTFGSLFGRFTAEERESALKALERLGVAELAQRRAETLSGGEQQRVAIARAIVQKPRVLLADEPVANLDPSTAETIMEYLERITMEDKLCTLVVLHQPYLMYKYCTKALAIRDGVVCYDGPPLLTGEELNAIYN